MKKENKEQNKPTIMIAPAGEWLSLLLGWMELVGMDVARPKSREYFAQISPNNAFAYSIMLALVRATDAFDLLEENPSVAAALTGTDILYEQEVTPDQILKLEDQTPWQRKIEITLSATPNGVNNTVINARARNLQYQIRDYTPSEQITANLIRALEGSDIYTSRPRAARKYFAEADVQLISKAGKLEGLWRINPKAYGVVDVSVTGATAQANGLFPIDVVDVVAGLGLVNQPIALDEDKAAVTAFLERITKLASYWQVDQSNTELYRIGQINFFTIPGRMNGNQRISIPLFFSDYLQSAARSQELLGLEATVITTNYTSTNQILARLERFANKEVLREIEKALNLGGYVLLPRALEKLEAYEAAPNRFVGVH